MWPGPGRRHGIRGEGFLTTLFRRACGREERQQVLLTSDPPLCVHHSCPQRRPLPNTTAQGNRRTRAQALRQHLSVDRPVGPMSSTKYTALCSLRGSAIPLFFVLRGGHHESIEVDALQCPTAGSDSSGTGAPICLPPVASILTGSEHLASSSHWCLSFSL